MPRMLRPPASVLLKQQYRMNPAINRFPSQQFYGGQVGDDISTIQRPAGLLINPKTLARCAVIFWESPVTFTEEVQEVASRDASTRSKANPHEAERCAQLASVLASRVGAKSVAVLSWYNAQVVELRRHLRTLPSCDGMHCGCGNRTGQRMGLRSSIYGAQRQSHGTAFGRQELCCSTWLPCGQALAECGCDAWKVGYCGSG